MNISGCVLVVCVSVVHNETLDFGEINKECSCLSCDPHGYVISVADPINRCRGSHHVNHVESEQRG